MKDRNWTILVWALILAGLGFAWVFRHTEDDAFITFRYSQHLTQGIGPVWNADQHVEGYTNFLWMVLMALPISLGLDPVLPATVISLGFLSLNLWLLHCISRRQTERADHGFWAWLPVAVSHTMLISATSGLETAMNGCLWTIAFWQLQGMLRSNQIPKAGSIWLLGITCGLAILSRPEGALLTVACFFALSTWLYIARHSLWVKLWHYCAAVGMVILPWLIWKLSFYGHLLPNTFYVKTQSGNLESGWQYALVFLLVSGCWIPELVIATTKVLKGWRFDLFLISAVGISMLFLAYVILAGGDYLEFRLLVPIVPLVLMVPVWRLARKAIQRWQIVITATAMVCISIVWGQGHGRVFKIWFMNTIIHPVDPEAHFMSFSDQGKALGKLLDYDPSIRLAIGACGAIPYYSGFYGIDLYGLNEPRREFSSYVTGFGPGHEHMADFAFLRIRKPHIVSLRCDYLGNLPTKRRYSSKDPMIAQVLQGATEDEISSLQILELPLDHRYVEVCFYLNPHPKIDSLIQDNSLEIYPLENI